MAQRIPLPKQRPVVMPDRSKYDRKRDKKVKLIPKEDQNEAGTIGRRGDQEM